MKIDGLGLSRRTRLSSNNLDEFHNSTWQLVLLGNDYWLDCKDRFYALSACPRGGEKLLEEGDAIMIRCSPNRLVAWADARNKCCFDLSTHITPPWWLIIYDRISLLRGLGGPSTLLAFQQVSPPAPCP